MDSSWVLLPEVEAFIASSYAEYQQLEYMRGAPETVSQREWRAMCVAALATHKFLQSITHPAISE